MVAFPLNETVISVFSENLINRKSSFIHSRVFPFIWVECQWRRKRFVTAMTGNSQGFYISMTNYPCIQQQFIIESKKALHQSDIQTTLPATAILTHRVFSNGVFVHVYSEPKKCKNHVALASILTILPF